AQDFGSCFTIGLSRDDDGVTATHRRYAIVSSQRIGNHWRSEILFHGEFVAIYRTGIQCRPLALGDGDVSIVFYCKIEVFHLPLCQHGERRVGAVHWQRCQMLVRCQVVAFDEVREGFGGHMVTGNEQDVFCYTGFHGVDCMLQRSTGACPTVRVFHEPVRGDAEIPCQIDGVIWIQCKTCYPEPVDVCNIETRVEQCSSRGLSEDLRRSSSTGWFASIGRLPGANDIGVQSFFPPAFCVAATICGSSDFLTTLTVDSLSPFFSPVLASTAMNVTVHSPMRYRATGVAESNCIKSAVAIIGARPPANTAAISWAIDIAE